MSQIQNVITTTFRARGQQAIASMGTMAQGFGNLGRAINDTTRMSERFGNQWRAISTTMRYAIAGSVVFGLSRLVTQLKDVQQQAGLIAAIGQQPGGLFGQALSGQQVTNMIDGLRNASVRALTPVGEMNDAATNFLSTVQNVQPTEVPGIITSLGQAAKLAQTPVDDLTKSVTSMNVAFGRQNNLPNIQAFSRMWFALISTAPGGPAAGSEIANQLPQLASMFMMGRGRGISPAAGQAQMLSLVLGSLRTGGTPSTSLRGLTYLLQSIAQPTGGARQALAGIGITPKFVEQQGIYAALMKLLNQVTTPSKGTVRQLNAMDDTSLDNLDSSGGSLPGISAEEMTRLRKMVPRIHGIRAAIILASQMRQHGDTASLAEDFQLMQKAQDNQITGALNFAQAWQRFDKRSRLQAATVALNSMSLQVAQALEPVMNFAASGVTGLQGAMARHPRAAKDAIIGTGAIMAAMGVSRFTGIGRGLLGKLNPGQRIVQTEAALSLMSGNTTLGASPRNPLYVIVVGPTLFGGNTPSPTGAPGGGGGGGGGSGSWFGKLWAASQAKTLFKMVRGRGMKLVSGAERYAAGAPNWLDAEFPAAGDYYNWLAHGVDPTTGQRVGGGNPFQRFFDLSYNGNFKTANEFHRALSIAQRANPNATNIEGFGKQMVNGRAEVYMMIDINQNGKVTRKRVHVPVQLMQYAPQTRGNSKTSRGN